MKAKCKDLAACTQDISCSSGAMDVEVPNSSDITLADNFVAKDDKATTASDSLTPTGSAIGPDEGIHWESQLNALRQQIEDLQEDYDKSYLAIGKLLIQARDIYKGHGDWIKWLKKNVPFSVRHAQRLIRVAEMFDDETLVSRLGLTSSKAYILTKLDRKDIDKITNPNYPLWVGDKIKRFPNMIKRELECAVKNYLTDQSKPSSNAEKNTNDTKESVEADFEALKMAMRKIIVSIKGFELNTRDSWISELETLYKTGIKELEQEPVC